jgi:thiamine-phosphate pyrophosphorylase
LTRAHVAPRLLLVTDRHAAGERPLTEVVAAALLGIAGSGVRPGDVAVQLREKDLSGQALAELARTLRAITAAAGVALHVNDRADVALAVGADGVHLTGTSLTPADVARIAPGLTIGVSTHAAAEVAALRAAAGDRVAFAVLGPINDTPAKRRYGAPLGTGVLTEAARAGMPLIAIGGIGASDVARVLAAGAHGVACIRAVMSARDPARAVEALCSSLNV